MDHRIESAPPASIPPRLEESRFVEYRRDGDFSGCVFFRPWFSVRMLDVREIGAI